MHIELFCVRTSEVVWVFEQNVCTDKTGETAARESRKYHSRHRASNEREIMPVRQLIAASSGGYFDSSASALKAPVRLSNESTFQA